MYFLQVEHRQFLSMGWKSLANALLPSLMKPEGIRADPKRCNSNDKNGPIISAINRKMPLSFF